MTLSNRAIRYGGAQQVHCDAFGNSVLMNSTASIGVNPRRATGVYSLLKNPTLIGASLSPSH